MGNENIVHKMLHNYSVGSIQLTTEWAFSTLSELRMPVSFRMCHTHSGNFICFFINDSHLHIICSCRVLKVSSEMSAVFRASWALLEKIWIYFWLPHWRLSLVMGEIFSTCYAVWQLKQIEESRQSFIWILFSQNHQVLTLSINQSIKFYLYSPYSQITVCLIGL